ncbi:MAG: PEP-CTERM sorting domain-containing protein [Phycisphaerales bacterium]|nr:PEP-CTERM sorting domain-containing protein [Phycisphaerales bacterium]
MKTAITLSACLCLAAGALPANASIISTTGMATQIPAPASCLPGALTAFNAWAWDEQQGILLTGMPVDLSTNPSNTFAPVPGSLTTLVDSHFLHFDGVPGTVITGTVTFSTPILGVQYRDAWLDLSDGIASTGTVYPTTLPGRGFFNWTGADFLDINGSVLTFQLTCAGQPDLEQARIFTHAVPAPASVALLGLGGLIAARRRRSV